MRPVTWEERLFEVFDDLEQQAEGLALRARDAEASARARDLYTEVDLASRLHASVGTSVELVVRGAGAVRGRWSTHTWSLLSTNTQVGTPITQLFGSLGGQVESIS